MPVLIAFHFSHPATAFAPRAFDHFFNLLPFRFRLNGQKRTRFTVCNIGRSLQPHVSVFIAGMIRVHQIVLSSDFTGESEHNFHRHILTVFILCRKGHSSLFVHSNPPFCAECKGFALRDTSITHTGRLGVTVRGTFSQVRDIFPNNGWS